MARMVNIVAIILGFISDTVATFIFTFLCAVAVSIIMSSQGVEGPALEAKLQEFLTGREFLLFSTLSGLGFTMMGGYVAGRIAKQGELFHAGAVGFINILFGLYFMSHYPSWYVIVVLLVIPAALIGGDKAKRFNRRNKDRIPQAPPSDTE